MLQTMVIPSVITVIRCQGKKEITLEIRKQTTFYEVLDKYVTKEFLKGVTHNL